MSNPLLSRLQVPGQSFTLPSKGMFYEAGVLDESAKDGVIHVHPLTSYDEIVMRNADHLMTGSSMYDVIRRRIPAILLPERILAKDMDYIFLCLRAVTYGRTMDVPFRHNCKEKAPEHKYEVDLLTMAATAKTLDPTSSYEEYTVHLPNGQVVGLRPIYFADSLKYDSDMMAIVDGDEFDERDFAKLTIRQLSLSISRVDEVEDPELIEEWMHQISAGWRNLITEGIIKNSGWGVDMKVHTTCKECGEKIEIDVWTHPANFFM